MKRVSAAVVAVPGLDERLLDDALVVVIVLDIVEDVVDHAVALRCVYLAMVKVHMVVGADAANHSIADVDAEDGWHLLFGYHEDCMAVFVFLQCLEPSYIKRAIALRNWLRQTWLLMTFANLAIRLEQSCDIRRGFDDDRFRTLSVGRLEFWAMYRKVE